MKLKLGASEVDLSGIDLILSVNSVPSLRLLSLEKFDASLIKEITTASDRSVIAWQDDELEVLPYSFEKQPKDASDGESYIHTLLLKESLEAWFKTKVEAAVTLNYGIYQNQSDVGGWTFLNSCLANQVLVPVNKYKERIDKILPISTCLARPIHQDNQQFLNTVVGYLQQHIPELMGWSAIHAEEEALRFIFHDEENAFELDESWENLSASLPTRFNNHKNDVKLEKTGQQLQGGKNMAFLKELSSHGLTTPLTDYLEAGSEEHLLYLPGSAKLKDRLFFCKTLTYSFKAETNLLRTSLSLSTNLGKPKQSLVAAKLEGQFKAWDADDDDEKRVFLSPPKAATWQLMDPKDSNLLKPDADLMAEYLVPTTAKELYSEFYIKRVEGDKVIFKTQGFQTPIIHGSKQKLTEKQEAATLSLNAEVIVLSNADYDTEINDMQGIIMNAKTIMKRTNKEVKTESKTITLAKNMQVETSSLSIHSPTHIGKTTTVKKVKVTGVPGNAKPADPNISYPINVDKQGAPPLQAQALITAAAQGAAFCEECEKAKASSVYEKAQAQALLNAAQNGASFCEECEKLAETTATQHEKNTQAQTLKNAAESGVPFCEECQAAPAA